MRRFDSSAAWRAGIKPLVILGANLGDVVFAPNILQDCHYVRMGRQELSVEVGFEHWLRDPSFRIESARLVLGSLAWVYTWEMRKDKGFHSTSRFLPYFALLVYFVCVSPYIGQKLFAAPFSIQLLAWAAVLPIVIISLFVVGLIGTFNIWRAKRHSVAIEPKYRDYARIAAFGFICLAVALVIGTAAGYLYTHQKFNAATWQDRKSLEWHPDEWTGRQRMANDLTENVLPGHSRSEVEALLGEADWTHENENGGSQIEYYLGFERGLGVDEEMLWIEFDSSGKLVRWDIYHS